MAYINDILVQVESRELVVSHVVVYLLQCLGFQINQKKSAIPGPACGHCSHGIETSSREIRAESQTKVRVDQVSALALRKLVGKQHLR